MDYQEAPQEFFDEVAEKIEGIKALVQKYGLEDQWVSAFVGGVYTQNEDGSAKIKTILDYVVIDEDELDEILSLAVSYFQHMDAPTIPRELRNTENWTSEDWMNFIHKNTDKDGDAN